MPAPLSCYFSGIWHILPRIPKISPTVIGVP